jgi:tRNA-Thr(GGU) m(6)t(6)A37 methyltransferase TsaA
MDSSSNSIQIYPVGRVVRNDSSIQICIDTPYRKALKELDGFSHVIVFWWAEQFDTPDQRKVLVSPLPYAEGVEAGVFACRSPVRPNLIMTTVCRLLAVDEVSGVVQINNIDAFDQTPVIDLKPYYPVTDRVQEARIPNYLEDWPEWLPDEGIGLMPHEE